MTDPVAAYRQVIDHPVIRAAWTKAYGAEFWVDGEAPWSQCTNTDIRFVSEALGLQSGSLVADLGCGAGSFGRYAAREFGTRIWGVDVSPPAIAAARERAKAAGLLDLLDFEVGDACATGRRGATFDGAVTLDVWLFVTDKQAFLNEAWRLLKPGASISGTTWELRSASAALRLPAFTAYEACVQAAGFELLAYEETPNWRPLMTSSVAALFAAEPRVRADLEPATADRLFTWAKARAGELDDSRRVRFHARKPR